MSTHDGRKSAHRPPGDHLTYTIGEAFRWGPEARARETRQLEAEANRRRAAAEAIKGMAKPAPPGDLMAPLLASLKNARAEREGIDLTREHKRQQIEGGQ